MIDAPLSASRRAPLLLLLVIPALAGCRGPTATIGEHGFPVFAEVVGADAQLERPDPKQTQGLDAFGERVDKSADHRFAVRFWPLSSEEKVAVEVKARADGNLQIGELAMAAYPVTRTEAERFRMRGVLPDPAAEPIAFARGGEQDGEGSISLILIFPRDAIPEGTERLALPTLARFDDGWVHVRFYQTAVPEPLRRLSSEEVEAFKKRAAEAAAQAAQEAPPAAEEPAAPAATEPEAADPSR